jgi:hypothetical protein
MNIISTSWTCQRCRGTFICEPPWHQLCDQCITDLTTLCRADLPDHIPCPSCGGPVCPDCGDAMTVLVPIPVPAPVAELTGGYRSGQEKVTGDDH